MDTKELKFAEIKSPKRGRRICKLSQILTIKHNTLPSSEKHAAWHREYETSTLQAAGNELQTVSNGLGND